MILLFGKTQNLSDWFLDRDLDFDLDWEERLLLGEDPDLERGRKHINELL